MGRRTREGALPLLAALSGPGLEPEATASGSRGRSRTWRRPRPGATTRASPCGGAHCWSGAAPSSARRRTTGRRPPRPGSSATARATPTSPPRCAATSRRCAHGSCPALGDRQLSEIRRSDLQRLVNRLMAEGLSASTHPQRADAAARDLPSRARARRGGGEPDDRRPAAGRPRPARADRLAGRGSRADRRAAQAGSRALGDGDVRGAALGRAPGARRRAGRSRQERDPRPVELGSEGRPRRA